MSGHLPRSRQRGCRYARTRLAPSPSTVEAKRCVSSSTGFAIDAGPGQAYRDATLVVREYATFTEVYFTPDLRALGTVLAEVLSPYLDKRLARSSALSELCVEFLRLPDLNKKAIGPYIDGMGVRSWKRALTKLVEKDPENLLPAVRRIHLAGQLLPLIRSAHSMLSRTIGSMLYIGPARARSERYYRFQELAVSEIDPDGKNFAMFLNSLRRDQLDQLSDWIESLFGYRIDLSRSEGHISINLVDGEKITNVVDTGYGVSQILPVLGQIWWAANRERSRQPIFADSAISVLAIEQPELHLHPAHQAFLADALVGAPASPTRRTHFLIETHSEALVNRLGQLVSEGLLRPADVQIVLFEADERDPRRTNTRIASFGESGELIDWPYGFFQPN
jgi:AAA ATPase domain